MKYDNQLRYASLIIRDYDGNIPLSAWLKDFYRENKQMGSRDRKTVSELVYSYYRLGHNRFSGVDERLKAAIDISPGLDELKEYFGAQINGYFSVDHIFPWKHELSNGIDPQSFSRSFLVQPDLFLRIRPGYEDDVKQKLVAASIEFVDCGPDCIAVANSTKVNQLLYIDKEAVIQDKSSQCTGDLMKEARKLVDGGELQVWDCCAASGGKSLMAYDKIPPVKLTVSDIRESILHNLKSRFSEAGINDYESFVTDLTARDADIPTQRYDLVIADVPCSGSGTWSRTPEQLFFSTPNKIDYYSHLQKSIVSNILPSLKPGGALLYLTCSVFRKENEEVVSFLEGKGLKKVSEKLFTGYEEKADTLFGSLLTNSSA